MVKNGERGGFFARLKSGLAKTKEGFINKVDGILKRCGKIDEELFGELEEALFQADVGVRTSMELVEWLRQRVKEERLEDPEAIKALLKERILQILQRGEEKESINLQAKPHVIIVVGVNGVGKTTTIGKLGKKFVDEKKKVLFAAADTFRAAAIDQLEVWARRVGADIVKHQEGADPAAVTFDAFQAARARNVDVLIIDTAGRLHNKVNLMKELEKIKRVISREDEGAPHEVLLILDATTGQNAIEQAKIFYKAVNITGIALTKLDGTAKGGVVIGICDELEIPVKFIGIGEGIDDLRPFNSRDYVDVLFG